MNTYPAFLTVTEVANLFRIHHSHVYNAVRANELAHRKFGRAIRISQDDALRWFHNNDATT